MDSANRAFRVIVAATASLLVAGPAFSKSEVPKKEILIFGSQVFKLPKFGPVKFDHTKHNKVLCIQCHHVYEDQENVWKEGDPVEKCAACHKIDTTETIPSLERAMHGQCLPCHKRMKKSALKTGPTLCAKCHPSHKGEVGKQ